MVPCSIDIHKYVVVIHSIELVPLHSGALDHMTVGACVCSEGGDVCDSNCWLEFIICQ